ncbi:unnamed protein product [Lactuca virosa]|uniref:SPRY domain-containing protein n=1 Tax=Lactuca virosa TaxID=75947 RepID=A0AAU9NQD6_9ASTR|nr:unnamed protein product [Lactuca virosa]
MASSVKRERSLADKNPSSGKKSRVNYGDHSLVGSSLHPITKHRVVLNPADCDLDFNIEGNGLKGSALYEKGFAYCWSGARATIGITRGKYCFSCKIVSNQPVEIDETTLDQKHLCRVGISNANNKVGNLGETEHSFGFGGTGKFSNFGKFSSYGERFNIGDTILCAVDMESKPMCSIGFAKNGKWLGIAGYLNGGGVESYFPHVLLKNVVVEMQFGYEDGLIPLHGYRPWGCAFEDGNSLVGPTFSDVCNCELIMMVGLPSSGKTTWAEKWANEHPEKRYILLGTNLALDQMKVPGLLRKQNYGKRFDHLMEHATDIFNTLLTRASKTPRNFIIDQTNVYKSARKRKLKPFANFQKIAVVVFPRLEELKARSEKSFREMGKEVPAEAVNQMLANFVLPKSKDMHGTDEYFDQVIYIELNMMESNRCLDEMKAKLQSTTTISPYSSLKSSNPVSSYPQEHVMQPQRISTHPNPLQSHLTLLQNQGGSYSYPSQTTLPNRGSNNRFPPRDDLNHRRSYSGYEHRASAPMGMGISVPPLIPRVNARITHYHLKPTSHRKTTTGDSQPPLTYPSLNTSGNHHSLTLLIDIWTHSHHYNQEATNHHRQHPPIPTPPPPTYSGNTTTCVFGPPTSSISSGDTHPPLPPTTTMFTVNNNHHLHSATTIDHHLDQIKI